MKCTQFARTGVRVVASRSGRQNATSLTQVRIITSIDCTPNRRRGVAVLLQCTAPEQNFGIVSTVAEVLWSKITAPEQIFGMVSSVSVAIVLHFTALEQNYIAEDQIFWNGVNSCKLLWSKIIAQE